MAVDHPVGSPQMNCLQLVDVLCHVQVPDWVCELQHQPNQGFVCLCLELMVIEPTFRFPFMNLSFAGLVCYTGGVQIPMKVIRECDKTGLFGRHDGMAMKVVFMVMHVPLLGDVEALAFAVLLPSQQGGPGLVAKMPGLVTETVQSGCFVAFVVFISSSESHKSFWGTCCRGLRTYLEY